MSNKFFTTLIIISFLTALLGGLLTYKIYQFQEQDKLARQNARAPEISITIIEGWTTEDIAQYLERQNLVKAKDFLSLERTFDVTGYPLLKSLPARNLGLQGFLFPDTYRIFKPKNNFEVKTGEEIIKKMLDNFSNKFTLVMQQQAEAKNLSVFQIVTLASIIEKETGRNAITPEQKTELNKERKIVAGIFYNRLKNKLPLQSDATINFITKKNDPAPSPEDLNVNSPYNTYKNLGLPPGPISNPSISSIQAALEPTQTDYFYFLHTQPEGAIIYSKTFEEHLKNKQKYLK